MQLPPSNLISSGGNFAIKNVPMRLRHLLSAESAANDGLAYPFVTIAIYLTVDATKREAIGHWLLVGCLCMSSYPSDVTTGNKRQPQTK